MLELCRENPRYLSFRGRPTVLVTSGEHYGAVINLDFDYVRYLDALAGAALNLTRVFVGSYVEGERSLHFATSDRNTLAPRPGRLIAPWARSDVAGYTNEGNRFDLDRWDDAYFARLRDFVNAASERGVVVEVTLFSSMYSEYTWRHSPMHAANNVNGVGASAWSEFTTLKDAALVARHEALVRKVVEDLKGSGNVYFEICNEPEDHRAEVREWIGRIATVIRDADPERKFLIAHNVMRERAAIPDVSVQNFHYTWGRDLTGAIEALSDVEAEPSPRPSHAGTRERQTERASLSFDESMGALLHQTAAQVRVEAWEFLIGGGGIYNGLSWEYTTDHPAGEGRGHHAVLKQLGVLKRFMEGLDLARMTPRPSLIVGADAGARARALTNEGEDYLVYLHHGQRDEKGSDTVYVLDGKERTVELLLDLPAGHFKAYWIKPATGRVMQSEALSHDGGRRRMLSPLHTHDILLRIRRRR